MKISIIGSGYVGLPIAVEFAKKGFEIISYDNNLLRVKQLNKNFDINNQISKKILKNKKFKITSNSKEIENSDVFIITVPTPILINKKPDLSYLKSATVLVCKYLKKKNIVVYESTTFPGCTDEICIPLLEKKSSLKINKDFGVAYSPERINPGDKLHTLSNVKKIISASSQSYLNKIKKIYNSIIKVGLVSVSSIKVAEAAKIIENTQRDLNIALVNELSLIFDRMGINTKEVINAAATKWNFHNYNPGLVGGHCIGIDPYYLSFKSKELGYNAKILLAGRQINEKMTDFISKKLIMKLKESKIPYKTARVAIFGFTFKENCSDVRNTKIFDLFNKLKKKIKNIYIVDPVANKNEVLKNYNIQLSELGSIMNIDVVILAVSHKKFIGMNLKKIKNFYKPSIKHPIFFDLKSNYNFLELEKEKINYFQL